MLRLRRRVPSIEPAHAANRFFSGTISLVDVRTDAEYRAVHVPGAVHVPLTQLRERLDELRGDRPIAIICRSGHRSAVATRAAQRHGLDAMSVTGGMHAWVAAALPAAWPHDATLRRHRARPRPGDGAAGERR
jgi:rhodanese-related sulfurtransferase